MTTSTHEAVSTPDWADDIIVSYETCSGRTTLTIQDASFGDAWLNSDTALQLDAMR